MRVLREGPRGAAERGQTPLVACGHHDSQAAHLDTIKVLMLHIVSNMVLKFTERPKVVITPKHT